MFKHIEKLANSTPEQHQQLLQKPSPSPVWNTNLQQIYADCYSIVTCYTNQRQDILYPNSVITRHSTIRLLRKPNLPITSINNRYFISSLLSSLKQVYIVGSSHVGIGGETVEKEIKTNTLMILAASVSPTDIVVELGGYDCDSTADAPAVVKGIQALVTKYKSREKQQTL